MDNDDPPTLFERPPPKRRVDATETGEPAMSLDGLATAPTQPSRAALMSVTQDPGPGPDDALSAIFRFHGRIRAALVALDKVARVDLPRDIDRTHARELLEFFTGPLVWHDVDEENSLLPRLRRRVKAEELEEVLDRVSHQHEHMESTIEELLPPLSKYAAGHIGGMSLRPLAKKLHDILEPHLALEEQHLLPFAKMVLTDEDLAEIKAEIESRRPDPLD